MNTTPGSSLNNPLITHAKGNETTRSVIDAYVKTSEYKNTDIQNHVEHLQIVKQDDIQNMMDNDIRGSLFMNHRYYFGDVHQVKFLEPVRG